MNAMDQEDPELAEMRGVKVPGASEYIGGAGGAVPFFINYSQSSWRLGVWRPLRSHRALAAAKRP